VNGKCTKTYVYEGPKKETPAIEPVKLPVKKSVA
jgi:hypothetical protein